MSGRRPVRRDAAFAVLALLLLLVPASVRGTEAFSRQTGKPCIDCHIDASGGGELTAAGKAFLAGQAQAGKAIPASALHRVVRFAAGFLHLLTAVMWFGTILYVHLLLKPAYAARGLPRGELIVGWSSIVLIALTGTVLTLYRVPSADALFRTRFGVLLVVKISIFLVMTATAFIVTFVVGPRLSARKTGADVRKRDMTLEELGAFAGKDGSPAYIAFKGTIYDASGSRMWKGGVHLGRHQAGFDLTDSLKLAPHGEDRVFRLPVVGKLLAEAVPERKPPHLKAFYFMTFLNLFFVLAVLFVIALWRWG
jgi:predicted heme/steroid binding protein